MRWVNLMTVNDYHQAHILSAALEEEDILSMEVNEITATLLPHLRQGITIRVKEEDYPKAKEIADRVDASFRAICPKCLSNDLKYQCSEPRPINMLETAMRFFSINIPLTKTVLIYTCNKCANTFKVK